jgi:DNA-binding transcriptional ArsR family regulator
MQHRSLDATFAALSDPTRRAILARLAHGERPVMELAAPFGISAPAITRHLKVLERAGLITRSREAQRRPCRLNAAPLREAADWVALYREHWEQRLERLDAYLQDMAPATPAPRTRRKATAGRKHKGKRA